MQKDKILEKEKKGFKFKTKNGKIVWMKPKFTPKEGGRVDCEVVEVTIDDKTYYLNYLDLHTFCYMIGNEEERFHLANLRQRQIREIPYNVTFKLKDSEKEAGVAKRSIFLPVDEVLLHIAQEEHFKGLVKKNLKKLKK